MPNGTPPPPRPQYKPPRKNGNSFTYVVLFALILTFAYYLFNPQGGPNGNGLAEEIPLNTFIASYEARDYKSIEVKGDKIYGENEEGTRVYAVRPLTDGLSELGLSDPKNPTEIKVVSTEAAAFWSNVIASWLPIILFIALIIFMAKQLGKGANNAFTFGKSQARVYNKDKNKTTFKDVAGMDEAKEELVEVVDFLKHPKKYTKIGAKIPRGVMLVGAPGTGKTLLARAVAGEANVPFFSISGSEFVEMFVGVGASRVRDLFQKAKRNAPCIIFIDEIDAVGRQRGFGMGGGHDEREQTLNQILTEMDGFEKDTNVIVVAATNRPDVLDKALMRPGRFDRRVIIDMPNLKERLEIIKVHTRGKPMAKGIKYEKIAQQTPGFSGADIENLVNEAAILAAKEGKKTIGQTHLEVSIEKVGLGPERKSRVLSPEEKKITAYHEVGHALVGHSLPGCDPVHKVTIISRGMALGATWFVPEDDKHLHAVSKFEDEICSLLGGYLAEKIFFKEVTTGASSDLKRATQIARRMVTEYGMSEELGPIIYSETSGQFMGTEMGSSRDYSEQIAAKIDAEVKKIIDAQMKRTTKIINDNKPLMTKISEDLLKKEVLSKEEFEAYF